MGAGGDKFIHAFNFHYAHTAGPGGREAAQMAKCRDIYSIPVQDRKDGLATPGSNFLIIDFNGKNHIRLFYYDRVKFAAFETNPAAVAFFFNDEVRRLDGSDDGIFRAFFLADIATVASIDINVE